MLRLFTFYYKGNFWCIYNAQCDIFYLNAPKLKFHIVLMFWEFLFKLFNPIRVNIISKALFTMFGHKYMFNTIFLCYMGVNGWGTFRILLSKYGRIQILGFPELLGSKKGLNRFNKNIHVQRKQTLSEPLYTQIHTPNSTHTNTHIQDPLLFIIKH